MYEFHRVEGFDLEKMEWFPQEWRKDENPMIPEIKDNMWILAVNFVFG